MTGFQKFIKYAAIVFGIYLSVTIILVLLGIANAFVKGSKQSVTEIVENIDESNLKDISQEYTDITNVEIDLENIECIIKKGETFKIEGNNIPDKLEIKQEGNTLKINDYYPKKSGQLFLSCLLNFYEKLLFYCYFDRI